MGFFDFLNPPELKPNEEYRGYEQPKWTLAENQPEDKSYEVRIYPAAVWTSTTETENSNNRPFWKLFNYIQGKNNKEQKMAMTVPVTMAMSHADQDKYTMSFYTPSNHQESPPDPSNPEVFLEKREGLTVYVRNFTGFAKKPQYLEQSKILYEDLMRNGVDKARLDPDKYYAVGYDSPFRLVNRRNEVWLVDHDPNKQ